MNSSLHYSFLTDYFPFGNNRQTSIKKWVSYLKSELQKKHSRQFAHKMLLYEMNN
jgi:hypothetical protein